MDMSEMEAARQRMDERVRRARAPRVRSKRQHHRITHQLHRATRQLRRPQVD